MNYINKVTAAIISSFSYFLFKIEVFKSILEERKSDLMWLFVIALGIILLPNLFYPGNNTTFIVTIPVIIISLIFTVVIHQKFKGNDVFKRRDSLLEAYNNSKGFKVNAQYLKVEKENRFFEEYLQADLNQYKLLLHFKEVPIKMNWVKRAKSKYPNYKDLFAFLHLIYSGGILNLNTQMEEKLLDYIAKNILLQGEEAKIENLKTNFKNWKKETYIDHESRIFPIKAALIVKI